MVNGLDYLFANAQTVPIGVQPARDPDTNGNGIGLKFVLGGDNGRDIYSTGLALCPIAAVGAGTVNVPGSQVDGWSYAQVIQDTVDYFAYAQNEGGTARGGWRYYANYGSSDNSTSQWPTVALLYARSAGATVPAFVASELAFWVVAIQNPDGGSAYDFYNSVGPGSNVSRTGTLLIQQVFSGVNGGKMGEALNYIDNEWPTTANSTWDGNFGHPYAMWAAYKGLEVTIGLDADQSVISNLHPDPGDIDNPNHGYNWWEDYCEYLVSNQNGDGSWPGYSSWFGPLATAWYINILAATEIPPPNEDPVCDDAYADPGCLWSPNNKLVAVDILGVTDPDGDPVTITITGITSDEPTASDEGAGGAKHAPDAAGVGEDIAQVRAERSGLGNGRVYEISFTASDGMGGECEGSVTVCVPHDQGGEDCECIDDGQIYDATQIN